MSRNIARFTILGVIAVLVLAATTGCFFGGGEEPEPTGYSRPRGHHRRRRCGRGSRRNPHTSH